jgi:hypothetical protein
LYWKDGWKIMAEESTIEWVCTQYRERVKALFEMLDLERDGLQAVKAAVAGDDPIGACTALLAYYRQGHSGTWLRWPAVRPGFTRDKSADAILNDKFSFYGQTDRVPRTPGGGLEWTHPGPSDDWEWTLALNRHFHLGQLLDAYRVTGNSEYVLRIDEHIRDWISASLPYPARSNATAIWRGLEISFRAKIWAQVFFGLQQDALFTPAARLLMLTSLPEHAHHLRHFHNPSSNWTTMELSALGMIAAAWPEYRESPAWLNYASATLTRELAKQVYPDGAQHELTSHYHWVALSNFEQFADICRGAGLSLPDEYGARLESMWQYLAFTLRPDGHGLLNNDSDLDDNRDRVLKAAKIYNRPDWAYIASHGAKGDLPEGGPSFIFPWAGQLVFRSGWETDALWAFFDLGPFGTAHQHNDKLHLSVSAFGRDLIVDSGRFTYSGKDVHFRNHYALVSRAHNVILLDGKGQGPGPLCAQAPIAENDYSISSGMTFARGTCDHFDALLGQAVHTRVVICHSNNFIIVADRIETDRARSLETLWHWHPRCTVVMDGQTVLSTDEGLGNLRIVPVAGFSWNSRVLKGQEDPHLQGWYSERYNKWEPNPTAVLTADIDGTTSFAWLLLPARGKVRMVRGEILDTTADALRLRIQIQGEAALTFSVPWRNRVPVVELDGP